MIKVENLNKTYQGGFQALKNINLEISRGEIFALLGPNGAGKTTLIKIICGVLDGTSGTVEVGGYDIRKDYRKTRSLIGLVPQELTTDAFETVWNTVSFTRGLFGKPANPAYIEDVLERLSLKDKRNNRLMTLSGGMKRRVLIAKALAHEPEVLFLDEPTAGVDVELRKGMWEEVRGLRESGVTVILTTHYIEEAELMADRVGIIRQGEIIEVEEKSILMGRLGGKELTVSLSESMGSIPADLKNLDLEIRDSKLIYRYDPRDGGNPVREFLQGLERHRIAYSDIDTKQSSLEDIFVKLTTEESP